MSSNSERHVQQPSIVKPDSSTNSGKERFCISSDQLFAGAKEVAILHGGEEYRLRVTSKGRLILTK